MLIQIAAGVLLANILTVMIVAGYRNFQGGQRIYLVAGVIFSVAIIGIALNDWRNQNDRYHANFAEIPPPPPGFVTAQ